MSTGPVSPSAKSGRKQVSFHQERAECLKDDWSLNQIVSRLHERSGCFIGCALPTIFRCHYSPLEITRINDFSMFPSLGPGASRKHRRQLGSGRTGDQESNQAVWLLLLARPLSSQQLPAQYHLQEVLAPNYFIRPSVRLSAERRPDGYAGTNPRSSRKGPRRRGCLEKPLSSGTIRSYTDSIVGESVGARWNLNSPQPIVGFNARLFHEAWRSRCSVRV